MLSFHSGKSQAILSMECLLYNELGMLLNQAGGKKGQETFHTGKSTHRRRKQFGFWLLQQKPI